MGFYISDHPRNEIRFIWPTMKNNVNRISFMVGWISFRVSCKHPLRARLHETQSELRPVWNLKPLWNVVPFTWQFTWRFHCSNFPNNRKTLLHMCKWYLLINANLINAKHMLRYWLFFKQQQQDTCALVSNFNDSVQLYFAAGIYCLRGKLAAVWNFTFVDLTEVKFAQVQMVA